MIDGIVLKNLTSGIEIPIHKDDTEDYILNYVDWGQIESSQYTYKYVNQVGVSVINKNLETRPVTIAGWIIAQSSEQMTERKSLLNGFVNPQDDIQLTYKNKYIIFNPSATIQYSREKSQENNEVIAQFKISGTAANPLFSDTIQKHEEAGSFGAAFHFPLIINDTDIQQSEEVEKHHPTPTIIFGIKQTSQLMIVTNLGSVSVGMKITFRANNNISAPITLLNINTRERFTLTEDMQTGEEIEVNTMVGSKSVRGRLNEGSEWENYYDRKDFLSTWLQLAVGDNVFSYNAALHAEDLVVAIDYSNGYLEVEECY